MINSFTISCFLQYRIILTQRKVREISRNGSLKRRGVIKKV